jgi:hypothetical protein
VGRQWSGRSAGWWPGGSARWRPSRSRWPGCSMGQRPGRPVSGCPVGLRVAAQWAGRTETWWAGKQQPGSSVGWRVAAWVPACSFSVLWCGEVFHELGVQVPKFQLSLVLYLSQACLQHLSKVPDSWSSCSLDLCPSCNFGSL